MATSRGIDVPIIDLAQTATTGDRRRLVEAVDRAASQVGFMQVVGHGVPHSAIDRLTRAMDGFFALPGSVKAKYRTDPSINRGYTPTRAERLSLSLGVLSAADLFEAFNVGTQSGDHPGANLPEHHYPANIWPTEVDGFRRAVSGWFDAAAAVARRITGVFALALDLPADHFAQVQDHSIDVLRLNNYAVPAGEAELQDGQLGMGAHTDYGIVTVLWADDVPGLQLLGPDGVWCDVQPADGALLVNLGDLLARWTNDRWTSTMHRVVAPRDAGGNLIRRRSAAFFHDGRHDALISCLPHCTDQSNPPRYAPITVEDHLAAKLAGSRGGKPNTGAVEARRLTTTR